jgi:site-specific recombinase XerD
MDVNMRGMRAPYQPSWIDKTTGEKKFSPTWWIAYNLRGKTKRESAHSIKESDAWKLMRKRHGEIALGKPVGPDIEKTTFEDMAAMTVADYRANGRKSTHKLEDSLNHLRGFFGDYRAVEITGDRVTLYITTRQTAKAAPATINNELAALGRMFTLAIRAGKAATKPYISKLALNNARKGFLEHDQFISIQKRLPEDRQPVLERAYITGWRVHSEILTRKRHHLDLKAGWLRLEPNETKNREGRMFPLTPRLRDLLEYQLARTEALQRASGEIIPWLFHRDGKPIKTFRRSWVTACAAAGFGHVIKNTKGKVIKEVADRIPHDLRRTAVRNLERAGLPRSAAMILIGHRTESIYRRHAIADESMLQEAGEKLAVLHSADECSKLSKKYETLDQS